MRPEFFPPKAQPAIAALARSHLNCGSIRKHAPIIPRLLHKIKLCAKIILFNAHSLECRRPKGSVDIKIIGIAAAVAASAALSAVGLFGIFLPSCAVNDEKGVAGDE